MDATIVAIMAVMMSCFQLFSDVTIKQSDRNPSKVTIK